jgi:hypothetical protein
VRQFLGCSVRVEGQRGEPGRLVVLGGGHD